jgi:drug/metabolite transporter (DMT)-like permease
MKIKDSFHLYAFITVLFWSLAPVITALLARFFYKEKLTHLQYIAIGIEFLGIIFMAMMDGFTSVNPGLLWLLFAALLFSVYNLLQRKFIKTYTVLQSVLFSMAAGDIMLAVFLPASIDEIQKAPPVQLGYILFVGIFSNALACITWTLAFSKAKKHHW